MKVLLGNKIKDMHKDDLNKLIKNYKYVIADIGTGDGGFVYKNAKENPCCFYIGIDSNERNLLEYSNKINKKISKGGLNNVLYVLCNAEDLPYELTNISDKIFINLPWGSLRDGLIKADKKLLKSIKSISKNGCIAEICTTYSNEYEENEIKTRDLPKLNYEYFFNVLKPKYDSYGICINDIKVWNNENLKNLNTRWAKKLAFGRKRDIFYYTCRIKK